VLTAVLLRHPAVAAIGSTEDENEAVQLIEKRTINTIVICPHRLWGDGPSEIWIQKLEKFLFPIREKHPNVVFIIFSYLSFVTYLEHHQRLRHYFRIPFSIRQEDSTSDVFLGGWRQSENESRANFAIVDRVFRQCEKWHHDLFEFDVAISYASEDVDFASDLANQLRSAGVRVFWDRFELSDLLGVNIHRRFHKVFSKKTRYTLMLISKSYAKKAWTDQECIAAQERLLRERGRPYILPVRIDDTPIEGLPETISFVRIEEGIPAIADLVVGKLWPFAPDHVAKRIPTRHCDVW
jgi:hypothetical protein